MPEDRREEEKIVGWLVRCATCGTTWVAEISFDLRDAKRIYHYCSKCKRNTFHEVIERVEED